jgi:large subunit ribosomal protein L25
MTESIQLVAASRDVVGKANRRLTGSNRLPAVVYGAAHEPQSVTVDRHEFELLTHHEGLTSAILKLTVDEHKPVNVIVKSIQRHSVKGTIMHVDFWAVSMKQKISTTVPIHFLGEAVGVKAGGVMTHNLRELHIESLPGDMPEYVDADITALEVGDSIHVGDLVIPENVTVTNAADEIVASVLAPKVEEVEEVAEEAAEPEVIGEKSEEAAGE